MTSQAKKTRGPYQPRRRFNYDVDWIGCEIGRKGMNQLAFAKHIGVRQGTVSDILRRTRGMSIEMAARFARGLGCQISDFLHHDQQGCGSSNSGVAVSGAGKES